MLRRDIKPHLYLIVVLSALAGPADARTRHHSEQWYQEEWCRKSGGKAEVTLNDGTRCDCITENYAIEVEFAKRWYQAVGQSLHYAIKTKRVPGIVLIVDPADGRRYLQRLRKVIREFSLPIAVWVILEE